MLESSANGRFLVELGLKPKPLLADVLGYLSGDNLTEQQRLDGMDFVSARLGPNGAYRAQYTSMGISDKKKFRFLPFIA